ncbi:PIN domain-containing protein [Halopenitus persicus]|uniref:PIN domain-containing protein n=1 Tax=Halopenitus persicus TaxID=1048396 RepID=UPI0022B889CB|nr:PIN domain-containing protein [Halopenitus persicus]
MELFEMHDGLSFGDATIAAYMEREDLEYLYSFDDDFDAIDRITRLETPNNPFTSPTSVRPVGETEAYWFAAHWEMIGELAEQRDDTPFPRPRVGPVWNRNGNCRASTCARSSPSSGGTRARRSTRPISIPRASSG